MRNLFLSLSFVFTVIHAFGQPSNFLHPDPSNSKDELLENVLELPSGTLIFCGSELTPTSDTTYIANGILIKTDRLGKVQTKKVLPHFGGSTINSPQEAFYLRNAITLISIQNISPPAGTFTPAQWVNWRRLDTALNIIKERLIPVDTTNGETLAISIGQVADTTYLACWLQDTNNVYRSVLMTLNDTGGVIARKRLDSSFFAYPGLNAEAFIAKGIEPKPVAGGKTAGVVITCFGFINNGSGPFVGPQSFVINVDAHLNLLDTTLIAPYVGNVLTDTLLSNLATEALPLLNNKYIVGSRFFAPNPDNIQQPVAMLGVSLYNGTMVSHKLSKLVPPQNSYDAGTTIAISGRSLVRSAQSYYAFTNTWDAVPYLFDGPESQWVLARYDTNVNQNKTLVIGETDYRYLARHIEPMRDGGVLLLGTRQNFVQFSGVPQRDYFVVRLDAAGNPLGVPQTEEAGTANDLRFGVAPNPGNGTYQITDAKGRLQEALVYNLQGQLLCRQQVQGSKGTLLLTGQPAGIYLLQIKTADGVTDSKRIILR